MAIPSLRKIFPIMVISTKSIPHNQQGLRIDWMLAVSDQGYLNAVLCLK